MSASPVGTPKGKTKTAYIHHGRRSLDSSSCSSTITTVDAKDLLPNHFTPSKGSYHDICKYGCRRERRSRSCCPDGKDDFLKLERSPRFTKPPLDSNSNRTNQVKRPNQSKPGVLQIKPVPSRTPGSSSPSSQQSRRLSEIIIPNRCKSIEKHSPSNERSRIKNGELSRKKEQALPEVSRGENSFSNKPVKKQNTTSKVKADKRIEEHVPEKILHIIEPKVESEGNEAISGTNCTDSTFSEFSSSNEETRDSDNSHGKVKFRKGKTIKVQHEDNNTRRLKFRQHISLTENQNCNANLTVKSPRKTEMVSRVDAPPERIMVKLRSQNFEEKQGSHQGSYNSLIEDTSNRLVEVQMGTVMALVKAFESVISIGTSLTAK